MSDEQAKAVGGEHRQVCDEHFAGARMVEESLDGGEHAQPVGAELGRGRKGFVGAGDLRALDPGR